MVPFQPHKHRQLLNNATGLATLVTDQIAESAHLDYKRTYSLQAPLYKDEVRIDGGALATSGEGYLVIGVDDSRDGKNVAQSVPGIPSAEAIKIATSINQLLGSKIDPPLITYQHWIVPVSQDHDVVVFKVEGSRGSPVSIDREKKDSGPVFYVRAGPSNTPLSPPDARLRYQELAQKRYLRKLAPFVVAATLVPLAGISLLTHRIRTSEGQRQLAPDVRAALRDALRKNPGHTIGIGSLSGDPEGAIYAQNLASVFNEAGWKTSTPVWLNQEAVGVILLGGKPIPDDNTRCLIQNGSPLHTVAAALDNLKIGALVCNDGRPDDMPMIVVGRNPESPSGQRLLNAPPPTNSASGLPITTPNGRQ